MTKLLSMMAVDAIPGDNFCESTDMRSFMEACLMKPLCRSHSLMGPLLGSLEGLDCDFHALCDKTLCEIFLDTETSIDVVKKVRTYGKSLAFTMISEAESAIGTTLYHAAIASALVFHDTMITSSTPAKIARGFTVLIAKEWMLPEISELFLKARENCQGKKE